MLKERLRCWQRREPVWVPLCCECEIHWSCEEGDALLWRVEDAAWLQAPAPSFSDLQWEEEQGESSAQSAQTAQQYAPEQASGAGKSPRHPAHATAMNALSPQQHLYGTYVITWQRILQLNMHSDSRYL